MLVTVFRKADDAVNEINANAPDSRIRGTLSTETTLRLDASPVGITVHSQYPDCVHTAVRGMESSCMEHWKIHQTHCKTSCAPPKSDNWASTVRSGKLV